MLLALGAISSALDVLQSLTSSKPSSPPSTGFGQSSKNPLDLPGNGPATGSSPPPWSGGKSRISPATMGALLAAQNESSMGSTTSALAGRPDALKSLFSKIDADHDGQISKSEFETALGAGGTNIAQADDVFGKLDQDGSETVSLDEMSSALKLKGRGHGHHASYNVTERMMARETQATSSASLSVSV
jgi:EF-hand domain pair